MSVITTGHIEDLNAARRKMDFKEVFIRHDLRALSVFWEYAVVKNCARENIVRNVDIPSGTDAVRMNVLSPKQESLYFETYLWMIRAAQFIALPDLADEVHSHQGRAYRARDGSYRENPNQSDDRNFEGDFQLRPNRYEATGPA